jgi:hypothetical protein
VLFRAAVKAAAKECSKSLSKKVRKEQHSEFRPIEDLLFKDEPPFEAVRMQGAVVDVASFGTMRVVQALTSVLGDGFHSALRMFPVLM